jgi:hypothetical protein
MLDTTLILSNTDRFKTHQTWPTAKAIPLFHEEAPEIGPANEQNSSMYVGCPTAIKIGV